VNGVEKSDGEEGERTVSFQFPLLLVRTKRGISLIDRLAASRVTRHLGWASLVSFPFAGAIGFSLILLSASIVISSAPVREFVRESGPFVHILIPGLNPYVPIIYGWLALIVGMVVHEGSHGILARSLGFRVKSSGLIFFLILLIGAFVDIDEEEIRKAPAKKTGRVMAAGPISNITVGLISLFCLLLVVGAMTPIANGVGVIGVYKDSPAYKAGIAPGDVILAINGTLINGISDAAEVISKLKPNDTVTVKFLHDGREGERVLKLASIQNRTSGWMGFNGVDFKAVLESYRRPQSTSPLIYLFLPTFTMAQWRVPFSDIMNSFYTSPIGSAYYPIANLLFWLWFVNFNLGVFNALPLYPLDGGQALRSALQSFGSRRGWGEKTAARLTTTLSLLILVLLISVIAGPYILR